MIKFFCSTVTSAPAPCGFPFHRRHKHKPKDDDDDDDDDDDKKDKKEKPKKKDKDDDKKNKDKLDDEKKGMANLVTDSLLFLLYLVGILLLLWHSCYRREPVICLLYLLLF